MIHIRTCPSNPPIEPAYCGERLGSTITEAYGYYGPKGDGYKEVCPACVAAWEARKPVPARETREEALARVRRRT